MDQLKTRIFERAIRMRRGVLIKSEKSSANTETGEDGRAVPAATKGAIDVDSVFADVKGRHSFFDKDRDMGGLTHGGTVGRRVCSLGGRKTRDGPSFPIALEHRGK